MDKRKSSLLDVTLFLLWLCRKFLVILGRRVSSLPVPWDYVKRSQWTSNSVGDATCARQHPAVYQNNMGYVKVARRNVFRVHRQFSVSFFVPFKSYTSFSKLCPCSLYTLPSLYVPGGKLSYLKLRAEHSLLERPLVVLGQFSCL